MVRYSQGAWKAPHEIGTALETCLKYSGSFGLSPARNGDPGPRRILVEMVIVRGFGSASLLVCWMSSAH
jgi:hypothetical protein